MIGILETLGNVPEGYFRKHKLDFLDLALLANTRECTKNGITEKKEGFYQYSAAWDSKHKVTLEEG